MGSLVNVQVEAVGFIAIGQQATGVIAIGQQATGVIALGQIATGVIAIGQVARGVVAVGMVAGGFVAVGMLAVGIGRALGMLAIGGRVTGMLAVGGRATGMLPLSLLPPPRRFALPRTVALEAVAGEPRWVRVVLAPRPAGLPLVICRGARLDVDIDPLLVADAARYAATRPRATLAQLRVADGRLVCDELMDAPAPSWRQPAWWIGTGLRLALLVGLSVLFWTFVAVPLGEALLGDDGALLRW